FPAAKARLCARRRRPWPPQPRPGLPPSWPRSSRSARETTTTNRTEGETSGRRERDEGEGPRGRLGRPREGVGRKEGARLPGGERGERRHGLRGAQGAGLRPGNVAAEAQGAHVERRRVRQGEEGGRE